MQWQVKTVGKIYCNKEWGTTYTRETVCSLSKVPEMLELHTLQILRKALFHWQGTELNLRIEAGIIGFRTQQQLPKSSSTSQSEIGDSPTTPFGEPTQP
jgi:hypothetical protein